MKVPLVFALILSSFPGTAFAVDGYGPAFGYYSVGGVPVPAIPKLSAVPSLAPGVGYGALFMVAGTTAGTCKLQVMAGTSTTPITILDNIGGGC